MADIGKGVDRVVEIVGGLKNFSRADDTKEVPADIHEMLDATLIILRNKYKDRIEVVQDYDRSLPPLLCYAGQLNQVFMNIIGNAIDAIDDKGTISIATRKRAENLEISIQDTGKGIPESVKKRIFDPFFTTKPIGQGTGLGLSISYGIVEKHNGSIEVQSVQGKGTEFLVVLPLR
jgi:signal transduction histidine kinase